MQPPLVVSRLAKTFTMHLRGGLTLPVVQNASLFVNAGECVVLGGPSGVGKSSILKMIYGNYAVNSGGILVSHRGETVDLTEADPRKVLEIRRETLGYVSQFLRTVPRVGALDIVAEPLVARGVARQSFDAANACADGAVGQDADQADIAGLADMQFGRQNETVEEFRHGPGMDDQAGRRFNRHGDTALAIAAGDFLRWRAAARQHRSRLHHRSFGAAAR